MARCPAHDDREPSLSISDAKDGKVLVRCHAGCDQRDVIAALRARGLWETERPTCRPLRRASVDRQLADEPDPDALKRTEAALAIWQASQAGRGNAGRNLSALARARISRRRRRSASMPD